MVGKVQSVDDKVLSVFTGAKGSKGMLKGYLLTDSELMRCWLFYSSRGIDSKALRLTLWLRCLDLTGWLFFPGSTLMLKKNSAGFVDAAESNKTLKHLQANWFKWLYNLLPNAAGFCTSGVLKKEKMSHKLNVYFQFHPEKYQLFT